MKKRNFLSHIMGMVERELEATLAILILLAGVVGYTLAGTETATQLVASQLQTQSATGFAIAGSTYSTITLDSSITGDGVYRLRKISVPDGANSNFLTIKGRGVTGADKSAEYTIVIPLNSNYSGNAYVWGSGAIKINGQTVQNSTTAVAINDSTLTVEFTGNSNVRAISTTPQTDDNSTPAVVANLSVVPNTASLTVGGERNFVAIATDAQGALVSNPPVTWTMVATPEGCASINSVTGAVTAKAAGKVVVTAKINGTLTASATVTILEPAEETPAAFPGATETAGDGTGTNAAKVPATDTTANDSQKVAVEPTSQTLLDRIKEAVTGGPADAATADAAINAAVASQTASAMFSPAVVTQRFIDTGSTIPSAKEVATVTAKMPLGKRIATTIQVGLQQMAFELHTLISGRDVTNANGEVILHQDNAMTGIMKAIQHLTTGAKAGTTSISKDEELPL